MKMFIPKDLEIRDIKADDVEETTKMIRHIQSELYSTELRSQVKAMFLHPIVWVLLGVTICVFGISLDLSPIFASVVVLVAALFYSKNHFQTYWANIKPVFHVEAMDLKNLVSYYYDKDVKDKRFFFVAKHRDRIVGTVALRESFDETESDHTCKLWRVFIHPATRRMGIATKLVKEALKRARDLGYSTILVKTHKTNYAAIQLYEKLGFETLREEVLSEAFPVKYWTITYKMDLSSRK